MLSEADLRITKQIKIAKKNNSSKICKMAVTAALLAFAGGGKP